MPLYSKLTFLPYIGTQFGRSFFYYLLLYSPVTEKINQYCSNLSCFKFFCQSLKKVDINTHESCQGIGVLWSISHVLDWEVGGSNLGKFMSFLPGCRLDLTFLFFWMRQKTAEWPINGEKKEGIWTIVVITYIQPSSGAILQYYCNINIIQNSEIQILDGHKKKTVHYRLSYLKKNLQVLTISSRSCFLRNGNK